MSSSFGKGELVTNAGEAEVAEDAKLGDAESADAE